MSSTRTGSRPRPCDVVVACAITLVASTAIAQESSSSGSPVFVAAGGVDVANHYMFRGVRQNSTGMVVWPFTELTAHVLSSEGTLRRIDANVGFWNSLNTGDTGADGPAGDRGTNPASQERSDFASVEACQSPRRTRPT